MSRREPERVHDFVNTPLTPHILLSSCSDSWNAVLAGSEISTRTYASVEHRMGKEGLEIYAIQVLNEPYQVLTLQVWKIVSIPISTKEIDELSVKLW